MKYVYDESVTVSYSLFVCPTCGAQFYAGGKPMHEASCPYYGQWTGVEQHFGPRQVLEAISLGLGRDWYGISLDMLQEQFPELLEQRE